MITNFKIFEAKRGRPKDVLVKCKKDFSYVLGDDHVSVNPQLTHNDKHVYPFFEKGKMYKMIGPWELVRGGYLVHVFTHIKHCIGPPNYPKFIDMQFLWDVKKSENSWNHENYFEDYFEMPKETNKWIEFWKLKKEADKYNI